MIRPIILSGGAGTRLWPLSRAARPKQLLALTDERTMLQLTALRVAGWPALGAPLVIASARHGGEILRQLGEIGLAPLLVLEPCGRNTAPAIAAAALLCEPDELMLVMPSDHSIADAQAFREAVAAAIPAARDGWLVTFGIKPAVAETGYGYLERGEALGAAGLYRVERFAEKPDAATAETYLASGRHYWNAGIFFFTAGAILEALRRHAPDILAAAEASIAAAERRDGEIRPEAKAFAASPSISIDYAVMEKAERVAVAPVDMGWSDVGSWDALDGLLARDEEGNSIAGEVLLLDSSGCSIRSTGPLVAGLGLEDLIVVATPDAVLIVPKGRSQDIRALVEALKRGDHPSLES